MTSTVAVSAIGVGLIMTKEGKFSALTKRPLY